jgi:hypothetical protein
MVGLYTVGMLIYTKLRLCTPKCNLLAIIYGHGDGPGITLSNYGNVCFTQICDRQTDGKNLTTSEN